MTAPHFSPSGTLGPTEASSPRLIVLEVTATENVKYVRVLETRVSVELKLELRDDWFEVSVEPSHVVRVICVARNGDYTAWRTADHVSTCVVIDRRCNLLIVHPDTLVSGTSVADSFRCLRKAVISSRTPASLDVNTAMGEAALYGSMIHDLFQNFLVLDSNTRDYSTVEELSQMGGVEYMSFFEIVEDVLTRHSDNLLVASIPVSYARKVMHKVVSQIIEWYCTMMGSGNFKNTEGVLVPRNKALHNVVVTKVHDIEELVWSPVLGLKGKIDASVHLRIDGEDKGIAVLELKSGKASGYSSVSHSAQVALYNLLLSGRKGAALNHGLLTYIAYQEALRSLSDEQSQGDSCGRVQTPRHEEKVGQAINHRLIAPTRSELIALIMQRNRLAAYLRTDVDIEEIPPVLIGSPESCATCFSNDSCLIQHKMLQGGSEETVERGPGRDLFRQKAGHLTTKHAEYYKFWRNVLADEEELACSDGTALWTKKAHRRETDGKCLSDLTLVESAGNEGESPHNLLSPGMRTIAEFRRCEPHSGEKNMLSSGLSENDYVVVSADRRNNSSEGNLPILEGSETWQCALTNGFVKSITCDSISVSVDRSLGSWTMHQGLVVADIAWSIDAEEIYASHNTSKRTLDALFCSEKTREGSKRLRELVVDGCSPRFSVDPIGQVDPEITANLNEEQNEAVQLSLRARDYALILGMPGTGKTATLAAIVLTNVALGRSVLVCSHTNMAVDNLLRRLVSSGFKNFVRLGRALNVVDEIIQPFHIATWTENAANYLELEKQVDSMRVVATTCLGINHWVLQKRQKFDVVVVDEASQMTQPICTGPLLFAKGAFILVGDHYQLPPLQRAVVGVGRRISKLKKGATVELETANSNRVDESLFRRLCVQHPGAMVLLSKQYRMAEEIMELCNEVVYAGALQCANSDVAKQLLASNYNDRIMQFSFEERDAWLHQVRDPSRRLLFVDVDQRARASSRAGGGGTSTSEFDVENRGEAQVVAKCVWHLQADGVKLSDLTVLSPYRAQVKVMKEILSRESLNKCQVSTVDQYQGKDNRCVIVSLVRCGGNGVGPLLKDWRRLNVIMTRAKEKLIFVGCAQTITGGSHLLRRLINFLKSKHALVETKTLNYHTSSSS